MVTETNENRQTTIVNIPDGTIRTSAIQGMSDRNEDDLLQTLK